MRKEDIEALTFATSSGLRKSGNSAAANIIDIVRDSPKTAKNVLDVYKTIENSPVEKRPEEALAISLDLNLSKTRLFTDKIAFFEARYKLIIYLCKIYI